MHGTGTSLAMVAEELEDGVRHGTDPRLERAAVGDALRDEGRDAPVQIGGRPRRELDHRRVGLAPADDLTDMQLVLAEVRGMRGFTSTKKGLRR
jgi:hypothetical protein